MRVLLTCERIFIYISAALFEPGQESLLQTLQNAITKVNMHQRAGPSRSVVIDNDSVSPDNSFEANKISMSWYIKTKHGIVLLQVSTW